MENRKIRPTDAELEILNILWDDGPSSVRYVNDKLSINKEVGYTTTLKLMQIMTEKGLTVRDTSARTHIYKATFTEGATKKSLLYKFMEATFQGSASSLMLHLLGNDETSQAEITEIKNLIEEYEKRQ